MCIWSDIGGKTFHIITRLGYPFCGGSQIQKDKELLITPYIAENILNADVQNTSCFCHKEEVHAFVKNKMSYMGKC